MSRPAEHVYQSLKTLPDEKVEEALQFVEFISQRSRIEAQERRQWADALRDRFAEIQELPQAATLTEGEIRTEVERYRVECRCKTSGS